LKPWFNGTAGEAARSPTDERGRPGLTRYIADFGETLALLPAIAAMGGHQHITGARWHAHDRSAGHVVAIAVTVLLKAGLGPISGHTAISTAFYGGLAALLWQTNPRPSWKLRRASLLLLCLVGLMAWPVCALAWHSPEDAISGLVVGGVCPLALRCARRSRPLQQPAALALLLLAIAAVMPFPGLEFEDPAAARTVSAALAQL
jgi:membrane-associated phospholipid phosphatase